MILTVGSRGDVQPFVALGAGLREAGHRVALAEAKGLKLGLHSRPCLVRTDRHALHRIVRNMMINAVRYTPWGGAVDVSIRLCGDRAVQGRLVQTDHVGLV